MYIQTWIDLFRQIDALVCQYFVIKIFQMLAL